MFKKILIANRGEIACRIIKTARLLGIETVAVYSESDANSLHVDMADEAVYIGESESISSYLCIENLLRAVEKTGADSVHPGYGFLSESATFARKLELQNVVFIGPSETAIRSMGDKIESKKIAQKAGLNVIPGHPESLANLDQLIKISGEIGYPVMLKASAGGGGKGMRVAYDENDLKQGFNSAKREALISFGDDRILVEKYIEQPRHIEIQIMADSHGNIVHLGERECSIQRRHQKIIEEAPSTIIDHELREAMGKQAIGLARAVEYVSAGTVEFIVDIEKNFYFLEMNTRLQVEHAVTEFVTGIDLVELMIRVAAGEELPLAQTDVNYKGWALESRIYAEDPSRDFLPSTGRIVCYRSPKETRNVRVDTGVIEGCEMSIHYDPLIAKLITHGSNRDEALSHMERALNTYFITGINHNISFLSSLISHPRFKIGELNTNFIIDEYPEGYDPSSINHVDIGLYVCVVACLHFIHQERELKISGQLHRTLQKPLNEWTVIIAGQRHEVNVVSVDTGFTVVLDDTVNNIQTNWKFGDPIFESKINDTEVCIQVDCKSFGYNISHSGCQIEAVVLNSKASKLYTFMPEKLKVETFQYLYAPIPGLLTSIEVKKGEKIRVGQKLAVVEAMKMENVLYAMRDGSVKNIVASPGDILSIDDVIIEFK